MDRQLSARQLAFSFGVLGVFGVLLAAHHALTDPDFGGVPESVLVIGISSLAFYCITCIDAHDLSDQGHYHTLLITLGSTFAITVLGGALGIVWTVHGVSNVQWESLLSLAFVVGAATSSNASLYVVGSHESLKRSQELVSLLTINQRVLRHNHRNKLNVVLGHLDGLDGELTPRDRERLTVAEKNLRDLLETSEMTQHLMTVWERDTTQAFDCRSVLEKQLATIEARFSRVDTQIDVPAELTVEAHPDFPQAVRELLENAVKHNSADVTIAVDAHRSTLGQGVEISISDTGEGIPDLEKRVLSGTKETSLEHSGGVGLWYIYWVITKSNGHIDITDNDPTGTTITLTLPEPDRR